MHNLRKIKGLKSLGGDYLGITSGNLIEARDNDPLIRNLLPQETNFKPVARPAYQGRKRLYLLSHTGTCLIMIKSSRAQMGIPQAQLYIYINKGTERDADLLADIRTLVSYRWPNAVLFISNSALKKIKKELIPVLISSGWKDLRNEDGDRAFLTVLPKLKIHS